VRDILGGVFLLGNWAFMLQPFYESSECYLHMPCVDYRHTAERGEHAAYKNTPFK